MRGLNWLVGGVKPDQVRKASAVIAASMPDRKQLDARGYVTSTHFIRGPCCCFLVLSSVIKRHRVSTYIRSTWPQRRHVRIIILSFFFKNVLQGGSVEAFYIGAMGLRSLITGSKSSEKAILSASESGVCIKVGLMARHFEWFTPNDNHWMMMIDPRLLINDAPATQERRI